MTQTTAQTPAPDAIVSATPLPEPHVLGVGGSPRPGGNSAILLGNVLDGAREVGATTEAVYLCDYAFSSCVGCEKCRTDKACTKLMDGMQLLYPKIVAARGLVLASPAHMYNITALMKAFIDRLYCYYDFTDDHPRGYSSRLAGQGRVAAVLGVGEQTDPRDMGFTVQAMSMPLPPLGYDVLAEVAAFGHFARGAVRDDEDALERARAAGRAMGRRLVGDGA